jgi:hypothetical protein
MRSAKRRTPSSAESNLSNSIAAQDTCDKRTTCPVSPLNIYGFYIARRRMDTLRILVGYFRLPSY